MEVISKENLKNEVLIKKVCQKGINQIAKSKVMTVMNNNNKKILSNVNFLIEL